MWEMCRIYERIPEILPKNTQKWNKETNHKAKSESWIMKMIQFFPYKFVSLL